MRHGSHLWKCGSLTSDWLIQLITTETFFKNHDICAEMDLPENGTHCSKENSPKFPCFELPNDVFVSRSDTLVRSYTWRFAAPCLIPYTHSAPTLYPQEGTLTKKNCLKISFQNKVTLNWTSTLESWSLSGLSNIEFFVQRDRNDTITAVGFSFCLFRFSGSSEIFKFLLISSLVQFQVISQEVSCTFSRRNSLIFNL